VPSSIDETTVTQVARAIQQRLDEINLRMSTYLPDSGVSQFNRYEGLDWFSVDEETARVVELSLQISRQSDGAFDITVGPLVAAWKFGAAAPEAADASRGDLVLPQPASIAALLERVGFEKLQVRTEPPALKKSVSGVEIDLSAIAKGYAVDQVALVLREHGLKDFFVEVGEEVRAEGQHPAGRPWICGIEKPLEDQQAIDLRVPVVNRSVATSGDYRQFRIIEGRRYAHTIDPRSGYPTDGAVALASIVAEDCAVADAWATAALVLGPERMFELARTFDFGLHMVTRDAAGEFKSVRNDRFPQPQAPPTEVAGPNWLVMVGATVLVFGLALAGMSVGVLFKRKPIAGSCGGLANMPNQDGKSPCELCANPSQECRELGRGARAAREARESAERAET
jgi:thiamine biosynthesis lipoprotein